MFQTADYIHGNVETNDPDSFTRIVWSDGLWKWLKWKSCSFLSVLMLANNSLEEILIVYAIVNWFGYRQFLHMNPSTDTEDLGSNPSGDEQKSRT